MLTAGNSGHGNEAAALIFNTLPGNSAERNPEIDSPIPRCYRIEIRSILVFSPIRILDFHSHYRSRNQMREGHTSRAVETSLWKTGYESRLI
jgi:hypothetical protein